MLRTVVFASLVSFPLATLALPGHVTQPTQSPGTGLQSAARLEGPGGGLVCADAADLNCPSIRIHQKTGKVEILEPLTGNWVAAEAISPDDPRLEGAIEAPAKDAADTGTHQDLIHQVGGGAYGYSYGYEPCSAGYAADPCGSPCAANYGGGCAPYVPYYTVPRSSYYYAPPVRPYVAPVRPYYVRPYRAYRSNPYVIYRYPGYGYRW